MARIKLIKSFRSLSAVHKIWGYATLGYVILLVILHAYVTNVFESFVGLISAIVPVTAYASSIVTFNLIKPEILDYQKTKLDSITFHSGLQFSILFNNPSKQLEKCYITLRIMQGEKASFIQGVKTYQDKNVTLELPNQKSAVFQCYFTFGKPPQIWFNISDPCKIIIEGSLIEGTITVDLNDTHKDYISRLQDGTVRLEKLEEAKKELSNYLSENMPSVLHSKQEGFSRCFVQMSHSEYDRFAELLRKDFNSELIIMFRMDHETSRQYPQISTYTTLSGIRDVCIRRIK